MGHHVRSRGKKRLSHIEREKHIPSRTAGFQPARLRFEKIRILSMVTEAQFNTLLPFFFCNLLASE
jgi:hypothetical protein